MRSLNQLVIFPASSFVFSDTCLSAEARPTLAKEEAVEYQVNFNVSKILPLTTLRTIDLAGGKISGPLFSRFCAKMRVFFEVFSALQCVQSQLGLQPRCDAGALARGPVPTACAVDPARLSKIDITAMVSRFA